MIFSRSSHHRLAVTVLVLSLAGIYLYTLAPGLTWSNNGSDGGDLITAAYTGGIAHPSGYPLYLLLARFFQFIPIGTLAYRTNLLSVVATISAAILVYALVSKTLTNSNNKYAPLAGMTAGFSFGLSPLVWSQAVITEVYAFQACLTAAILYLYIHPLNIEQKILDRLRGLLLGLTMGNHITTIFLLPLIFITGYGNESDGGNPQKLNTSSLFHRLVWFLIGISIYLILPLRALTNPPVNWANPVTLKRFWWLVSGELYQNYYLETPSVEIWERVQAWASLLFAQFGFPGIVVGLTGLILLFKPSRMYLYTIWISLIYSFFAIIYSADDSYVYLIPVYISFAIWIGLAVGNGLNRIPLRSNLFRFSIGLLCVGYFFVHAAGYAGQVDASHDSRAEMFGRQVMSEVPNDALVFVKGDKAVFTVWYFHFALKQRPDLVVIAEDLLHFDWYQETLQNTYPMLSFPEGFPWAQTIASANPAWANCYVQYIDQAEIGCE